jgi:hypothetical protein
MICVSHSTLRLCVAAALLAGGVGAAQAHVSVDLSIGVPLIGAHFGAYRGGYYGGYHGHRGWGRAWGPGVVIAAPVYGYGYGYGYGYDAPVVVEQAPVVVQQAPAKPSRPDPVIYPRNAQSAQQTEYDHQECDRWATTQPSAVADASVFQRAVEACMDGRGYTLR